jgi:redox-sensitive bicupin YhaK (pirin superfamily)
MITIRKSHERGHANHGWLNTYHTFSFANYYDPNHMGVSHLRVINEDRVQPGAGFAPHSHKDMEIISYVLDGALEHKDSMGNSSVIRPGEVQRMSAGTGVTHSEYNASATQPVHFLQIWIVPARQGLKPSYEQKYYSEAQKRGRLMLVASPDGREDSVTVHQDAYLYVTLLKTGQTVSHPLANDRTAYVQVTHGEANVNGQPLVAGDGAAIQNESALTFTTPSEAEVLLFDLA